MLLSLVFYPVHLLGLHSYAEHNAARGDERRQRALFE